MKILQLILRTITAAALIVIAVQLTKITQPVINIAAPQIPAPINKEVIVQVDVPAPQFSSNISTYLDTSGIESKLLDIAAMISFID